MLTALAAACAALAALLHVYIFMMESIQWTQPRIWKRFNVADQATADLTRPMAYNQGFYNLFLAIGTVIGLALYLSGGEGTTTHVSGFVLTLFSLGCMAGAALVLPTTGPGYIRPAIIQGTLPVLGFVLFLVAYWT